MKSKSKLIVCLLLNVVLLLGILIPITVYAGDSAYWRFGPQDDLYVISIAITTWKSYLSLSVVLFIVGSSRVIIEDIGTPILSFSIYNPEQKVIHGFSQRELQFFANAMFVTTNLRYLILMVVGITQFDLAILSLFSESFGTFFVIRYLTKEKTFINSEDELEEV